MNNTFIKSLSVENFASFAERIDFTMIADIGKKEYLENTFQVGDIHLNKVSFLYGANGSGKTAFCKILREIQRLLDRSPLASFNQTELRTNPHLKALERPVETFAFDMVYKDKPTYFSIDIILDGITYHYEFTIKHEQIQSELLTKKYKRTEKLLERTSPSYKSIDLKSELKDFDQTKSVVKEESLCLSIASVFENPLAKKIVNAISDIKVLSMTAPRIQPAQSKDSFSKDRIENYTRILQKTNPILRKLNVSVFEDEIPLSKSEINDDFENKELIAKKTTVNVETEYALYENGEEKGSIPIKFFTNESLGTIKLFTALPHLYNTLETGGVLFVDELENGLHLSLAKQVIELFADKKSNPFGAQLICTSHQPLLIDGNIRRDQVWIMSKNHCGKSSLHRMTDIKTSRATVNLANKLIEGALGYNPENFFENNI